MEQTQRFYNHLIQNSFEFPEIYLLLEFVQIQKQVTSLKMFNLPQNINMNVENWIDSKIKVKYRNCQTTLLCQNDQMDHRFYKLTYPNKPNELLVIEVELDHITQNDVHYWLQGSDDTIKLDDTLEIHVENQRQLVLISIKTVTHRSFWLNWFGIRNQAILNEENKLVNKFRTEVNQNVERSTRKNKVNRLCTHLDQLEEWNNGYPISLYQDEIKSEVKGRYFGYISNKVEHLIHGKHFEVVTLCLYEENKRKSEFSQKFISLVNLYNRTNNNDPSTYTMKNISINKPENTIQLLMSRRYDELFKKDYQKFFNAFSKTKTEPVQTFLNNIHTLEKYSILFAERERIFGFIKFLHAGIYIGNGQIVDFGPNHQDNGIDQCKIKSVADFIGQSQTVASATFQDKLLSDEEIEINWKQSLNRDQKYHRMNNNCEHNAFGIVLGIMVSPQVKQLTIGQYIFFTIYSCFKPT